MAWRDQELRFEMASPQALEQPREGLERSWSVLETVFQTSNEHMLQIRTICDKVAQTDVPILVLGEPGAGKEVVARYVHARSSPRQPFVKVNCAAVPPDLLESELFGYERGAFTGAHRDKPGKLEWAARGTVLLDEVAEINPRLQAKLLRILQDGEYSRLGGNRSLICTARIIATTNKRLDEVVALGQFREDLYFRLGVITIVVPPLRQRREDIVGLCNLFVEQHRAKYGSQVEKLPPQLLKTFRDYDWPGNVRQLENAVKRFLIFPDLRRTLAEFEDKVSHRNVSLREIAASAAEKAEKEVILRTLSEVGGNRREAARRLRVRYKSLVNRLRRWQPQEHSLMVVR